MTIINSWRSKHKGWDRWAVKIRLGKLTVFDLYLDFAKRQYGIILFNLGIRTSVPQKRDNDK